MTRVLPSHNPADDFRATIDKAIQEIRRVGWCVLKDIILAAEADRIRKRVLEVTAEVREGVGQTLGLVNYEQSFAPYLADPRILGPAEAFFGPFVRISETAAVVNHPDNPRGHWHADWPFNQGFAVRIQAPYANTLLHLGTFWSLTPFPGAQEAPRFSREVTGSPTIRPATLPWPRKVLVPEKSRCRRGPEVASSTTADSGTRPPLTVPSSPAWPLQFATPLGG